MSDGREPRLSADIVRPPDESGMFAPALPGNIDSHRNVIREVVEVLRAAEPDFAKVLQVLVELVAADRIPLRWKKPLTEAAIVLLFAGTEDERFAAARLLWQNRYRLDDDCASLLLGTRPYADAAVPILTLAMRSGPPDIRVEAAMELTCARYPDHNAEAYMVLAGAAESGDQGLCFRACEIACHKGPAAAPLVPALVRVLRGPDPDLRYFAVKALGEIGPAAAAALPALDEIAADPDLIRRPDDAADFIPDRRYRAAILAARRIRGETFDWEWFSSQVGYCFNRS